MSRVRRCDRVVIETCPCDSIVELLFGPPDAVARPVTPVAVAPLGAETPRSELKLCR